MIQAIEVQVISKILTSRDDPDVVDTLMSYAPDLYFSAYQKEIEFIHDQKTQYGVIPSEFNFLAQFPDFNIVSVPEPIEYLVSKLRDYRRYLLLIESFNKLKDLGDGDVNDAWKYLSTKCDEASMLEDSQPMDIVKDAQKRTEQIIEYSKQQRIPTGFPELDKLMYGGLSTVEELLVIIARTNSGKAQPLWSPVLTPTGWTTMGKLKVGDEVVGKDNDNGRVIKIFPQGVKDYYRIYFDDNTYTECCDDHLWVVKDRYHRLSKGEDQVLTTKEIRESIDKDYSIDLTAPIEFVTDNAPKEVSRFRNYRDYITSSAELKQSIINDNFVEDKNVFTHTFKSASRNTIHNIAQIARSLGNWVKIIEVDDSFVAIMNTTRTFKKIVAIEHAGQTECQCILLDNESHTYITNSFTVTHNTWVCTKMMETAQASGFPVAYYSPEMQSAYLGTRFDTWRGHYENSRLIRGDYSQEYYKYIKELQGQDTSAYVIEDKDFPDGVSIRTLEPFVKKKGIKLLIIDGISYMNDDRKATRDQEKYKNIALGLFQLSKKYGCAVVLVMQANREVKSKDDKGEVIPSLYNAEGSDQPARIATQAFGVRQIFDKHVLDIGLLKTRMADNRNPVFSYAWDINTGQTQYIPGDDLDSTSSTSSSSAGGSAATISTPSISFGDAQPDSSDLSLLDSDDGDLVEF